MLHLNYHMHWTKHTGIERGEKRLQPENSPETVVFYVALETQK